MTNDKPETAARRTRPLRTAEGETVSDRIVRLLDQWDAEVAEHGVWTSGHSIASKMAKELRAALSVSQAQPIVPDSEIERHYPDSLLRHAVNVASQYTPEFRMLAAEIIRLRSGVSQAPEQPKGGPILLSPEHERAIKDWAADDRLWNTQDTTEFNLRVFARKVLALSGVSQAPPQAKE